MEPVPKLRLDEQCGTRLHGREPRKQIPGEVVGSPSLWDEVHSFPGSPGFLQQAFSKAFSDGDKGRKSDVVVFSYV